MIIFQRGRDAFFVVQLLVDLTLLNVRTGDDAHGDFVTIRQGVEQFRSNTQTD